MFKSVLTLSPTGYPFNWIADARLHPLEIAKIMFSTIGPTHVNLLKLACPLVFLVAATSLQAQDKPAQAPTKAPMQLTETLTPQQALELNEIAALRARMGGGVSQRLKGAVPGSDPDQQFHDSLKSLAAQVETTPLTLLPTAATRLAAKPKRKPAANSAQTVLRVSAKKLEDLAAELEQAKFYDKADELRATAAKYWLQARSLD